MQEQLISFETAKLAKEKGFNIPVIYVFDDIDGTLTASYVKNVFDLLNYNTSIHKCSRPAQSLLQKWLREKYNIYVSVYIMETSEGLIYFDFGIKQIINWLVDKSIKPNNFKTYEKALEEGLQQALKLI